MISATHTHSTPGGYMQDLLFDLSVLGFVQQSFMALMTGIVIVSVARGTLKIHPVSYSSEHVSSSVADIDMVIVAKEMKRYILY